MKRVRLWPGMIFGLIGLNIGVVAVTIYAATSDRSFAVEPGYDVRALAWDEVAAQRRENARLGWSATVEPAADARTVLVRLTDAAGAPVRGAAVEMTAFASVRAADRTHAWADPSEDDGPGAYRASIDLARPGLWEFRITARRGADVFTANVEVRVPAGLTRGAQ